MLSIKEKLIVLLQLFLLRFAVAKTDNQSLMPVIEELPESYCAICGEGPHWDVETQSLYFVDIDNGMLMRYDYNENKVYKSKLQNETFASFIIPIEGQKDKFAVGCERRVVVVSWDGKSETCSVERTLFEVQAEHDKFKGNRINDGKCDPQGRLFAGTMRHVGDEFEFRYGELYKYENGSVHLVKSDVGISNGLAWNEKTKKFYYIDTTDYEVKEYDYDFTKGVASNPRVCFDLRSIIPTGKLLPDGMTIDTDGNIYVATFNGHTIYKVDPRNGNVLQEFKLPCKQITSVAFGGPNLDILYVTSAAKFGEKPPAGRTFKITGLGAKGFPMNKMRL